MRPLVTITCAYIVIIMLVSCWWPPIKPVGTTPPIGGWSQKIEQSLSRNMSYGLPAETSALLRGIMLGEKTEISREVKDMFSNTGVMHILAVSGMNVGMVAAIFFFIFTKMFRLTRKYASFLLIFIVIIFGQITGSQSSVNRAVVMAIVGLVAVMLEREKDMLNTLALAALVLLVWEPRNLFDVGFQLSFAATLGIVLLAPRLTAWLKPAGRLVGTSLAVSLAAQITVTPFIIYYFHKFSLVSPLANLAVVPLVGVITILGFSSFFGRLLFAPVGNLLIQLNHYLLLLLLAIVKFFDHLPLAFIYLAMPGMLFMPKPLEVSYINVGQGDSILVSLPDRRAVLIDGGGGMNRDYNVGDRRVAPYLWSQGINRIDTVILTHAHYNHLQGLLPILDKFKVRQVIMPAFTLEAGSQDYMREFLEKIKEKKIYLVEWSGGERINWSRDLALRNIAAQDCLAFRLSYKGKTFLFTSDSSIKSPVTASVCQLPNHGKMAGNPLPKAEYLVVSGKTMPVDERIWSSARDGNIKFICDGESIKVKTSK